MSLAVTLMLLIAQTAAADTIPFARDSRHMLIPFVGFQYLNDLQAGYRFQTFYTEIGDTTVHYVNKSFQETRDDKGSVLGIIYRYNFHPKVSLEASLASVHNGGGETFLVRYDAVYDFGTFVQRTKVNVTRDNLIYGSLESAVALPVQLKWLSVGVRLGTGYAVRDVKFTPTRPFDEVGGLEPTDMLLMRGGIEFTAWRGKNFICQGSLIYTTFQPTDSQYESFGGLGWSLAVFPFWSGR